MKFYTLGFLLYLFIQISFAQEDYANPYLKPFRDAAVATQLTAKAFPSIIKFQLDSFLSDLTKITSDVSSIGSLLLKSAESALNTIAQNLNDYVSSSLEASASKTSEEISYFIDKAVSLLVETDDRVEHLHNVFTDYVTTDLANYTNTECFNNITNYLNSTARNVFKTVFKCATDRADEVYKLVTDFETHLLNSDEQIKSSILGLKACIEGLSANATDVEQSAVVNCILPLTFSTIEAHNTLSIMTTKEASDVVASIKNITDVKFPDCSGLINTVNRFDVYEVKGLVEACKTSSA